MPTSITVAPGLIQSPRTISARPTAATTMSDRRTTSGRSRVREWAMVTVQFDTQFIDAARIGELMISRPRVVRATRSLIFMQTEITAAERCVATASGVFRIFSDRSAD